MVFYVGVLGVFHCSLLSFWCSQKELAAFVACFFSFAFFFWFLCWCIRGFAPIPHFLFGDPKRKRKRHWRLRRFAFFLLKAVFFYKLWRILSLAFFLLLSFFGFYVGVFGALPPFPTSFLVTQKGSEKGIGGCAALFFYFLLFSFPFPFPFPFPFKLKFPTV